MPFWGHMTLQDANSPVMEQLINFHDHTMMIIMMVMLMVSYLFLLIFNNKFYNRFMYENHKIEIIWTLMPAVLLIFIAIPSIRLLYLMEESFAPSLTIKIMGHQWYWSYQYRDFDVEFDSFMLNNNDISNYRLLEVDNRLIVPFLTKIRFLISSSDVAHAWALPSLGLKIDAIPGRLNQLLSMCYRPGIYFGQCSEICGVNHSFMPICMEVTSLKNFFKWIKN